MHLPSEIGAYEAEEVGVEHLLRNIRDTTVGTVADQVNAKLNALRGLKKRMEEMYTYLDAVCKGEMPVNHQIIYNLQVMSMPLRAGLRAALRRDGYKNATPDNAQAFDHLKLC